MRLAPFALLLTLAAGCHTDPPPAVAPRPAVPAPPPGATAASPTGAPVDPLEIRWVRESAEHEALVRQVYRAAQAHVEDASVDLAAGSWGVILDADETVISNATYQSERARQGLGYTSESWAAWVKRREATAQPGVAAFLNRVRELGGRIAIVTNRRANACDDTKANFESLALIYDVMLCRTDEEDKNPRFEAVERGTAGAKPMKVIAFIGDNILDFPKLSQKIHGQGAEAFADFGARFFVLPNPMYGSWVTPP
jgi:5'-nucleotidase (lipoprotein e(P4) family)